MPTIRKRAQPGSEKRVIESNKDHDKIVSPFAAIVVYSGALILALYLNWAWNGGVVYL